MRIIKTVSNMSEGARVASTTLLSPVYVRTELSATGYVCRFLFRSSNKETGTYVQL